MNKFVIDCAKIRNVYFLFYNVAGNMKSNIIAPSTAIQI